MASNRKLKGFGIVEVLIASTVIVIILFALTSAGKNALAGSTGTQQRAQALNLAQEGVELVRQIRDTNWIDGNNATDWDTMYLSSGALASVRTFNSVLNTYNYNKCTSSSPCSLSLFSYDPANTALKRYVLAPSGGSSGGEIITLNNWKFVRNVKVEATHSNLLPGIVAGQKEANSMKVTVTVQYGSKSVSVSEILTNWRPDY